MADTIKREEIITKEGEKFIKRISATYELLSGNNGVLPYSDDGSGNPVNKIWKAKPKIDGNLITSNEELGEALIVWFNKYGKMYDLDPNILAAQSYIESNFRIWIYPRMPKNPKYASTAMGITQFLMKTFYDYVVKNLGGITPRITEEEISILIEGLDLPYQISSYGVGSSNLNTATISRKNHPILLQNIMDNPNIMIKAQVRFMRYLSDRCENLASTSLFCYSRGQNYAAKTFTDSINKARSKQNDNYINTGTDYVNKIFNVLGNSPQGGYKPKNYYFGYNIDFTFDEFATNTKESENI